MALSNRFGWLVLATGNKSEYAVGYSTLYGDMAGGFAPIKDVPKTLVYDLCAGGTPRRADGAEPPIPDAVLDQTAVAPSSGPTSRTPTPCPRTRCSTRSSRPTSRTTSGSTK